MLQNQIKIEKTLVSKNPFFQHFFTFVIDENGNKNIENGNAALNAAYSAIVNTLYTRTAMSNPLSETCTDSYMASQPAVTGNDYAYKTVMLKYNGQNACGVLIPDDADLTYTRVNGANGAAIVFYDTVNGNVLYNYGGAELKFASDICANNPSFSTFFTNGWTDSNSWFGVNLGPGIQSVQLYGECYDLDSNLPEYAYTTTFKNPTASQNQVSISFNQKTPFHPTTMEISSTFSTGEIGKFHVHQHAINHLESCSDTGGHYNPLNVDLVNNYGNGVHDSFEIGDLSGKHGKFSNLGFNQYSNSEEVMSLTDSLLPIWGMDSIAGRSIVFHAQDGSRLEMSLKNCKNSIFW